MTPPGNGSPPNAVVSAVRRVAPRGPCACGGMGTNASQRHEQVDGGDGDEAGASRGEELIWDNVTELASSRFRAFDDSINENFPGSSGFARANPQAQSLLVHAVNLPRK